VDQLGVTRELLPNLIATAALCGPILIMLVASLPPVKRQIQRVFPWFGREDQ
jgi:hypothetical protein